MQPVCLNNIEDPDSWTQPQELVPKFESNSWVDFYVIDKNVDFGEAAHIYKAKGMDEFHRILRFIKYDPGNVNSKNQDE